MILSPFEHGWFAGREGLVTVCPFPDPGYQLEFFVGMLAGEQEPKEAA